jgi:hypothetical protein
MLSKASIETVVEIDKVSGIPKFEAGEIEVNDYRFRKVDENTRVAFLDYVLKDRIVPVRDNRNLLRRFDMEIVESTKRHGSGFVSRGALRNIVILVMVACFVTPIIRIFLNRKPAKISRVNKNTK